MGQCLSCFNKHSSVDVSVPHQKNNDVTSTPPLSVKSQQCQVEPLLPNNHNYLDHQKSPKINDTNTQNEDDSSTPHEITQVNSVSSDRSLMHFYHKLPSIPRAVHIGAEEYHVDESKISQLFDQYKDSAEDAILAEGIENLCNDLQLEPDDFKILVLAWKLNASQMCRFTKSEFTQGMKNIKTDSIKGIQLKLNEITNNLKCDSEQFKDLYRFTFKFGLDSNGGQRILPLDIALVLWRLVFTNNAPAILERWLSYLSKSSHIRGIPKDTWNMFLNFCDFVGNDLSTYDDTEAWPSLFDDFVEYENDHMNQNVNKNEFKLQD